MSIRVDDTQLIAGAIVVGDPGLGVLAQDVPSTGDAGAGYAYAYLSLPADNGREVRGLIVTPPSAGTLTAYEDTSFVFEAPDGEYTFDWRLFVDGVDGGLKTETLVIGDITSVVHELVADNLTTSAQVLGSPAVGQIHALTATALVVGSPVLGTPVLTENAADVDALTAVDLVMGSPVPGAPSLGQIYVLGSDGLVTGAPVLGSPSITQLHALEALGLTVGAPVLGTPALNGSDIVPITASEVARIVRATPRMKTVTASARVKQVRYEVTRA